MEPTAQNEYKTTVYQNANINFKYSGRSVGRICTPTSEKDHPSPCGGLCFHLGLQMVILRSGTGRGFNGNG